MLLTTVMLMHGNVSFRNMSRYSSLCEKTFSGQFGNPSDSAESDMIGTEMSVTPHTLMIAATDRSFITGSGSRAEAGKGLEISELAAVDVNYDTAYSVSAWQTPDPLSAGRTRTDRYVEHFVQDAPCLPPSVRYPAADGYYAENKSVDGVTCAGYHLISELRHDADLRYLYAGGQKPKGRPEIRNPEMNFRAVTGRPFGTWRYQSELYYYHKLYTND